MSETRFYVLSSLTAIGVIGFCCIAYRIWRYGWWDGLPCCLLRHHFVVHKHITGDHDTQTWRALLRCLRCRGLFVMSEPHQAFLRYDNDPQLRADLLRIYPQLTAHDLNYEAPRYPRGGA